MAHQFHLADLFETVAATVPARIAIQSDSLTLTYAELNARADRLASGMAAHGIGRGDTVGLYLMNRAEHLEAFIAIVKLGAVPFNINYRYREEELRYLLTNARTAALIHGAEFRPVVEDLRPYLPTLKISVAVADGSVTALGSSVDYVALLKSPAAGPWPRAESDIILTYTGGTTGMPKGVMWPHKAFIFACAGAGGHFNPAGPIKLPEDIATRAAQGYPLKMFPIAPLMHAAALWAVWSALLNGLTIVFDEHKSFEPIRIWDKCTSLGVNIIQVVGDAMAIPLRDALRAHPGRWQLGAIVNFGSGGAVFSQHVKDDLHALLPPNAAITDGLGSSETGYSGQAMASNTGMMQLKTSPEQQIIVDDRLAAPGETGLIARSGHTPIGYFGDAAKTAEVFRTINGRLWVVSGDAGRLEEDGTITVFGRGSTCINSGGEKIFPEEVEEALRAHPAVSDAVVAGQADPRWGERVVAIIAPRSPGAQPTLAELRAFLAQHLAGYKIPKAVVWVGEVRRSPAGKQDYRWAKTIAAQAPR